MLMWNAVTVIMAAVVIVATALFKSATNPTLLPCVAEDPPQARTEEAVARIRRAGGYDVRYGD